MVASRPPPIEEPGDVPPLPGEPETPPPPDPVKTLIV